MRLAFLACAALLIGGCSTVPAPEPARRVQPELTHPPAPAPVEPAVPERPAAPSEPTARSPEARVETGIASWYGKPFHGRRTASGEVYDMHAMTAAHKTLPLRSWARVRNPANGREVVVRVNDRGPFKPGRIIDLSLAAARRLGIAGIAPVEVTRLAAAPVD